MDTVSPIMERKTFLHLKTKGIWAFFDKNDKVATIRLDALFKDAVNGIKIGDTLSDVKAALGEPIKKPTTLVFMTSYFYVLNDVVSL